MRVLRLTDPAQGMPGKSSRAPWRVSGTVPPVELGPELFGTIDWFADGAMAEYCVAPFSSLALKPPNLTHGAARTLPSAR